jgi:hypothetical protein
LKLTSTALAGPADPPPPQNTITETPLKRDEWMLAPAVAPVLPLQGPLEVEDTPMTEDYGDPSEGKRTLGGGVDFFSSLGTEVKKKPRPAKPNPDQVRFVRL